MTVKSVDNGDTTRPKPAIGYASLIEYDWYILQMVGLASVDNRNILQRGRCGLMLETWSDGGPNSIFLNVSSDT